MTWFMLSANFSGVIVSWNSWAMLSNSFSAAVGLMAWSLEQRPELLAAAIAAEPALVSVSFGDPAPFVGPLHDAGIAVATAVNSRGDLDRAVAAGADVIVVQGTEAGGHTGQRATLPLLQEVLTATDRPVLAAGGIATGAGLTAVLVAGAAGAWIGTPFLSCTEATNSPAARERVRAASGDRTVLTSAFDIAQGLAWPSRWPGRAPGAPHRPGRSSRGRCGRPPARRPSSPARRRPG